LKQFIQAGNYATQEIRKQRKSPLIAAFIMQ